MAGGGVFDPLGRYLRGREWFQSTIIVDLVGVQIHGELSSFRVWGIGRRTVLRRPSLRQTTVAVTSNETD